MKAVKGIYEHGQVKISDPFAVRGRRDVLVIFPDDVGEQVKVKRDSQRRKELLNYFLQHRKKTKPLECSVKDLIEEGRGR